jgi:hypothetical protein
MHFESTSESWESMFTAAADFASEVGPDRLIGISHSHGQMPPFGSSSGVVTVWYWEIESAEHLHTR